MSDEFLSTPFLAGILAELVRTPSQNPGDTEAAVAALLGRLLDDPRLEVEHVEGRGRTSLGMRLRSEHAGPALVLNGHMDTVPVGDRAAWSFDPFGAEISDGCLYGRGACDMKAGLAVQVGVMRWLLAGRRPLRGDLVLHFAAGEETSHPGTKDLLRAGFGGAVGIVLEPTRLEVATAARGASCLRVTLSGRGGHGGQPWLAANPVAAVPALLQAVERYPGLERRPHPLLPPPSCTPTVLHAGGKENVIPQTCVVGFDRRLVPGDAVAEDVAALEAHLRSAFAGSEVTVAAVELVADGFEPSEIAPDSAFARLVAGCCTAVTGRDTTLMGTSFASDVSALVQLGGIEAVTFGPGDIAHAHAPDERVPLGEVEAAARTIAAVVEQTLL